MFASAFLPEVLIMATLYALLQAMSSSQTPTKTGYHIDSLQENPPIDQYDDFTYDLTLKNAASELIIKIDWFPDGVGEHDHYRIRHLFADHYFKDADTALAYLKEL